MSNIFMAGRDLVRWELTSLGVDGPYRLMMHRQPERAVNTKGGQLPAHEVHACHEDVRHRETSTASGVPAHRCAGLHGVATGACAKLGQSPAVFAHAPHAASSSGAATAMRSLGLGQELAEARQ